MSADVRLAMLNLRLPEAEGGITDERILVR